MAGTVPKLQLKGEPTLDELLSEPAVLALLQREGLNPARYREHLVGLARGVWPLPQAPSTRQE